MDNNNGSNWAISTTSVGIDAPDKGTPGDLGETNLPVELIHFSAKVVHQQIELFWQTASEINNNYFEIQHSIDGKNFQSIGEMLGQGTTNQLNNYSFSHQNPANGLNYYRLKQVDFDGKFEYNNIALATINTRKDALIIYPNPIQSYLNVRLPDRFTDQITIDIYSITGQFIRSKSIKNSATTFHLSDIPSGSYYIKVRNAQGIKTAYFIKNK